MPRVLLTGFCAVPGPRRAGVQLRHVIRALTPMHNVDLLVAREDEQAYVERQGSVRVLRVPMHETDPVLQISSFQRALKRQLEGADYDIVHCRDAWSGTTVIEARERFGFRVLYDLTRSPLGETTGDHELDTQHARDEERCLEEADFVLAPTPTAVKALARLGNRVMLSPPGVDIDQFDWDEQPRTGVPRIVYLGSLDAGRGLRVLVRAMAAIVKEVDARLVLAGAIAPAFEASLRAAIRTLGLDKQVELLAPVDHDQIPALLATAHVCVVPAAADFAPSPMAIYPTKLLEYMACRRAIVAPRRETIAEVVDDGREALLFAAGDPIDLARKVLRLLGEPALGEALGARAYERVRRDFTASAARRALRRAYDVLVERYTLSSSAADEDAPKLQLLADDDFEATVFEESPAPASAVDTALNKVDGVGTTAHGAPELDGDEGGDIAPPPLPALPRTATESGERSVIAEGSVGDETIERRPVSAAADDWVVTGLAGSVRPGRPSQGLEGVTLRARGPAHADDDDDDDDEDENDGDGDLSQEISIGDDGTPIEGVLVGPPVPDGSFVAGEIEVPTRPPAPKDRDRTNRDRGDSPNVLTPSYGTGTTGLRKAGSASGSHVDEDTGSRTHRRS